VRNSLQYRYFTNQQNICRSKLTNVLIVPSDTVLVVTVCVVGGVVVVVVVLESPGFQILNCQYVVEMTGADSASFKLHFSFSKSSTKRLTTKYISTSKSTVHCYIIRMTISPCYIRNDCD
jgi:hypothetical protein